MKVRYVHGLCIVIVILTCLLSGCITPPAELPESKVHPDNSTQFLPPPPRSPVATPTAAENFLSPATPFPTQVTPTLNYRTWTRATPDTADQVCLISLTQFQSQSEIKKTADTFNLKNPPMYINYSITDVSYVSGTVRVAKKYSTQSETASYTYVNPVSFLEITVRNQTTGAIYVQDGFGKGHGQYLNKVIRVSKPDDLLIETSGYLVTGVVGIWVKPVGNFEDTSIFAGTECKNPRDFPPNSLELKETPTPAT
ncbi:MAG: hypothetical protein WC586_03840 [Methanoregula sp.]